MTLIIFICELSNGGRLVGIQDCEDFNRVDERTNKEITYKNIESVIESKLTPSPQIPTTALPPDLPTKAPWTMKLSRRIARI